MQTVYIYVALLTISLTTIGFIAFTKTNTTSFTDKLTDLSIQDRLYAEATQNMPAVNTFLEKYPSANMSVEYESNSIEFVNYFLTGSEPPSKAHRCTVHTDLNLRIPIDRSNFTPVPNNITLICYGECGGSAIGFVFYPTSSQNFTVIDAIKKETCDHIK